MGPASAVPLLYSTLFAWSCSGLTIIDHSSNLTAVRGGEQLNLFCEASQPYRWCYWSQGDVEHQTMWPKVTDDDEDKEEMVEVETEDGFKWLKNSRKCGLVVDNVGQEWSGTWKCHLADTDAELDGIRDEKFVEVVVGREAVVSIGSLGKTTVGVPVEVACNIDDQGIPPVQVALLHQTRTGSPTLLRNDGAVHKFTPGLDDEGSVFFCNWTQKVEGSEDELYAGTASIDAQLEVVAAPTLNKAKGQAFVWEEEPISIEAQLLAKPWPQSGDVVWRVDGEVVGVGGDEEGAEEEEGECFLCGDESTCLHQDQVCDGTSDCPIGETTVGGEDEDDCNFGSGDHPGTGSVTLLEFGEFSVSPLEEVGDGGYLLKTGLSILQLRKSVTIILEVCKSYLEYRGASNNHHNNHNNHHHPSCCSSRSSRHPGRWGSKDGSRRDSWAHLWSPLWRRSPCRCFLHLQAPRETKGDQQQEQQ